MVHASHHDEFGVESVEQFVEHAPIPIQRLAPDGTVLQANQALLDLLGYERDRYVSRPFGDFHTDPGVVVNMLSALANHETVSDMPARLRCQNGSVREVLLTSNAYWKDDQLVHTRCFIRDITKQKGTSDVRDASEARYRDLYDNAPDMMVSVEAGTRTIVECNQTLANALGYAKDEICGRSLAFIYHPDVLDQVPDVFDSFVATGAVRDAELQLRRRDGTGMDVSLSVSAIRDGTGAVVRSRSVFRDISVRKRAERSLLDSEALFRTLAETSQATIALTNGQHFVYVNPRLEELTGYTRDELTSMEDMLLSPPELRESLRDRAQARLRGDEVPGHYLTPMLTRSGETRWIEAATSRVKIGGEPLILITGVDITERKQAEQKLLESETKFRAVADSSNATITLSNEQRFVYVNPRAEEVTGYTQTELLKMKFTELLPSDMQQVVDLRAQARLRGEDAPNHYEVPFLKKDGEPRWLDLTVTVVELGGEALSLATGIDITARKHQEQALRAAEAELHAQKLDIVARLAGTVAHDFNNLLTLVVGHSDLLLRSMPEDDPHRDNVTAIAQAADSATALTQRLLGLSRRDLIHPRVLHPNETVTKTQHLLPGLIGEHIQVVVDLDPDVANIRVDPNQLEQVLINLAANGRDAMPEGGVLRIATMDTACDAAFVRAHRGAEPGAYVAMSVSDTGHGMDEATAAQVFEPFYTTKARHEGTGLGLATVHDIVTRGGGFITLETAPERGSTFTAYFPKVDGGEDPIVAAPSSEEPVGGTETILLVEDAGPLRSLLGSRLRDLGYTVLSACDGPEALELCGEDVRIDLLFTDVVMPGMNGRELMEHLTARAPGLRTLFMSGYTDAILGPRNTLDVEVPLLRKPFTPDEAARQIRQVLGAG